MSVIPSIISGFLQIVKHVSELTEEEKAELKIRIVEAINNLEDAKAEQEAEEAAIIAGKK